MTENTYSNLFNGPYSFDDEFEEDFNDKDPDEILDGIDEDAESYEEAFSEEDDLFEPYDDVEPEDGYTNPYRRHNDFNDDYDDNGEDGLY